MPPLCTGTLDMLECIAGWQCAVSAQGPFVCVEACDPLADTCGPDRACQWTGDGPCQAINPNYICEPFFFEEPPGGLEDLGVCVLPQ